MITPFRSLLLLIASACLVAAAHAADAAKTRKVLLIGIDGCRPDAFSEENNPTIMRLAMTGLYVPFAYVGGEVGTATEQETSSAPGWSTILTGVWADKHGVHTGSFGPGRMRPTEYPHVFHRVKSVKPELSGVSFVSWAPINKSIVGPVKGDFAALAEGDGSGPQHLKSDDDMHKLLLARLANADDSFLFVHYDQPDGAGHNFGFSPKVAAYLSAGKTVDGRVAEILKTIQARKTFANEDWLITLVTDHGGTGKSHGMQYPEVRRSFFIVNALSGGVPVRKLDLELPMTIVTPTLADWLGVEPKAEWGWSNKSLFALVAPKPKK